MSDDCSLSFADLFRHAHGRDWTDAEAAAICALDQRDLNDWVRRMAAQCDGRIITEDRVGGDGVVYTAFRIAAGHR
jgi:hypothetical protein